jgi:predicted DNA-binding protein
MKKFEKKILICITKELYEQLNKLSNQTDTNISNHVRYAIKNYLNNNKDNELR